MNGKTCSKCATHYADIPANFKRGRGYRDGFQGICKGCGRENERKRYARNKDAIRGQNAARVQAKGVPPVKTCRTCGLAYPDATDHFHKHNRSGLHPDCKRCRREQARERHAKEGEENSQRCRDRYRANRERYLARNGKNRAARSKAQGSHSAEDVRWRYAVQKGRCYWCKRVVGNDYHVDHVIPLSKGGSNGRENIVVACPPCNLSKKDKMPAEFAGVLL